MNAKTSKKIRSMFEDEAFREIAKKHYEKTPKHKRAEFMKSMEKVSKAIRELALKDEANDLLKEAK